MTKVESISGNTNCQPYKKAAKFAATGAVLGAGAAYIIQKRAIAKDKAAKEAAAKKGIFQKAIDGVKSGISKVWGGIKSVGSKIKTTCKEGLANVVNSGKISKMGIAKSALAGAIILPAALWVRNKLNSSKKD